MLPRFCFEEGKTVSQTPKSKAQGQVIGQWVNSKIKQTGRPSKAPGPNLSCFKTEKGS